MATREVTVLLFLEGERAEDGPKVVLCRTNLKLINQTCHKGAVEAALGDENAVGELCRLTDLQIFLCRRIQTDSSNHKLFTQNILYVKFRMCLPLSRVFPAVIAKKQRT